MKEECLSVLLPSVLVHPFIHAGLPSPWELLSSNQTGHSPLCLNQCLLCKPKELQEPELCQVTFDQSFYFIVIINTC
jgi:hypothetical protein